MTLLYSQIRYGVREYACTAIDMIARRLRLAFLNNQAAQEALPAVIDIMAEELKWSEKEKKVGLCLMNYNNISCFLKYVSLYFILKAHTIFFLGSI